MHHAGVMLELDVERRLVADLHLHPPPAIGRAFSTELQAFG